MVGLTLAAVATTPVAPALLAGTVGHTASATAAVLGFNVFYAGVVPVGLAAIGVLLADAVLD